MHLNGDALGRRKLLHRALLPAQDETRSQAATPRSPLAELLGFVRWLVRWPSGR
jgi:hypothetical protein